jgi:hypothetical protein
MLTNPKPKPIEELRQQLFCDIDSNLLKPIISDGKIEIMIPMRTVSEANCFEPWQKRHRRHKAQKKAVHMALLGCKQLVLLPCIIKLTRFAPKPLDAHDNLRIALKYILDQCCAEISGEHRPGLADSKEGFTFEYAQEKSKKYAVKIEITWEKEQTISNYNFITMQGK